MRLQGVGQLLSRHPMLLFIVGALVTATAVLRVVVHLRVPGLGHAPYLGAMSEQWLAEYRAEHP